MIEVLEVLVVVSMVTFGASCVCSGFAYLLALDKSKVKVEKDLMGTLFLNYWSKENVLASCKESWVPLVWDNTTALSGAFFLENEGEWFLRV